MLTECEVCQQLLEAWEESEAVRACNVAKASGEDDTLEPLLCLRQEPRKREARP